MTIQTQIKALLEKAGIASKEIKVYGSQIVVTSHCQETAHKWAAFIGGFAKVRSVVQSYDERAELVPGKPKMIPVWRTFASI